MPVPARGTEVVWGAGIDLESNDAGSKALVWPEEMDRLMRLRAAIAIARRAPSRVIQGDLATELDTSPRGRRGAPRSSPSPPVLAYLEAFDRERFATRSEAGAPTGGAA